MYQSCQCTKIGVRDQFRRPRFSYQFPRSLYVFKPAQAVREDAACAFCRLLAASISTSNQVSQSVGSLAMFQDKVDDSSSSSGPSSPGVRYIAADVAGSLSIMPLGDDSGMIGVEPGNYDREYARSLQGNIANRNLMRSWLDRCMDSHTACQEIEQGIRRRMRGPKRLLNTKTRCVELADWESRYLALSYVWGDVPQPNVHGLGC